MSNYTSVIIPAFNRPELLLRAVKSVLSQQGVAIEVIVIDDGSAANLEEVAATVEAAGGIFHVQSRGGVAAARNRGIALANADWIAFLDSDDYWLPSKLKTQLAFHQMHPEYLISQTDEQWFRDGVPVTKNPAYSPPSGRIFENCLERCCISPSAVVLHRSLFQQCGVFDEALPVCEDFDLWIRIAAQFPVAFIDSQLVVKHAGCSDQLSQLFPAMDRFRVYALFKLLLNAELTLEQREQVQRQVINKLIILKIGGLKRKSFFGEVAESILDSLENGKIKNDTELQSYVTLLANTWTQECDAYLQST